MVNLITRYAKLRGRIVEKYGTFGAFASAFGITKTALSSKLHGRSNWSMQDMEKACQLLDISISEDVGKYFFAEEAKTDLTSRIQ